MPEEQFENCVTLRPARMPDDKEFLETLYADMRRTELLMFGWDRDQEDAFFKLQFDLQTRAYAMQFPEALNCIVGFGGRRVGRVLIERCADEVRLIDISLLADYRNRRIGSQVLEKLKADSRMVILCVRKSNIGAKRFYDRHGFETIEDAELQWTMRWKP